MIRRVWNVFCLTMGISTDEDRSRTLKWMNDSDPAATEASGKPSEESDSELEGVGAESLAKEDASPPTR